MSNNTLVFIDSRVNDHETLISNLPTNVGWHLLDAGQDGIGQMQNILANYSALDAIHVISHGATGTLHLGSAVIDADKVSDYQSHLNAIGASLTETGDILFYGCNVGSGEMGQTLLKQFAQFTGADVAASEDMTGAAALGGNWELENHIGMISPTPAVYSLNTVLADDYPASTATTGNLLVGSVSTGNIESKADYDWFKITLAAGTTYRLEALGRDTSNGTLEDPYLELFNGAGMYIKDNDDGGTGYNASIIFTPTASGTYYLAVSEGWDENTGSYTVSANTTATPPVVPDDFAESTATTGSLSVGSSATGTIESEADYDWFRTTLTAGMTYRLEALGLNTSNGTLEDPYLELYNGAGVFLTDDDDSGTGYNSSIIFTPTTSGTYYLTVSDGMEEETGTYTITATTYGQNTPGTPVTSAQSYLAQYNVSMQQAFDFVAANIEQPQNIYQVAKDFGLTNQMLAEIVGHGVPNITANDIKAWFGAQGYDASVLDAVTSIDPGTGGGIPAGSIAMINTSMAGLNSELQKIGMLDFSNKIMGSWRDAGADFDMDGVGEGAGESLGGRSISEAGLMYLLNVGIRMTEADATTLQNAIKFDPETLMNNPNAAENLWATVMNVYNSALSRPAPTAVTPEMLDSVASGYVTMIGQIKPIADMLAGYNVDLF